MGHQTVKVRNEAAAMENFPSFEGVYLLQSGNPEQIANLGAGVSYSGGGTATINVIKGETYNWTKGANDLTLVNNATDGTAFQTLTASGSFVANSNSVTVTGTASQAFSGPLIWKAFFQKLWLYPFKSFSAGTPTANAGNIRLGKSGTAAPGTASTQYLPDLLQPTDLPIQYSLPLGQKMAIEQVIIKGTATDGVFYQFT
jgi:hypothetical protein